MTNMRSVQMIDGRIQEPKSDKQPAHDLNTEAGVFIPIVDIIQHAWYHVFFLYHHQCPDLQ